jgi:hypothetical protein
MGDPVTTVLVPGVPVIVPEAGVPGDIVVTALSNGKGSCISYGVVPGGPTDIAMQAHQYPQMWTLVAACQAVDPALMAGLRTVAASAI